RGRILLDGNDVTGLAPNDMVRRGVVLVPEARQLWPGMTVLENLEMGAYARPARKQRAETLRRVLDMFPILEKRAKQKAGTLSGGEQQMCAIGRGLMARPRLLLLDEPSLGLAPLLVRLIFETLKAINETGTTILLVEQNVARALALSHRAYVIENGRIVLDGPREALQQSPHIKQAYLGL